MTSLIGRLLGRYTVLEEIGRGGMARVYRAQDNLLRRMVALKILTPQLALDTEYIERFEREAIIAATLDHPNIVRIYDVYEHEGLRCIAMEFISGRSLHSVISERGSLGLSLAITICASVGAALDFAHSKGAVHRDIKPHNILLSSDGRVLLTDFGIAQAPETRESGRLTRTGFFMGTPEYISPEQASAQQVDGRSDLYSLGITAYETVTGKVPFMGATPQLMLAHLQTPPPSLSTFDPNQPPELDLVLARALAKNPDQRFQTAADFVAALDQVASTYQIQRATPSEIALLVRSSSSEGEGTISISSEHTPVGQMPSQRPASQPNLSASNQPPTLKQQQPYAKPATVRPATPRAQPVPIDAPQRLDVLRDWRVALIAGVLGIGLLFLLLRSAFGAQQPIPPSIPTASAVPQVPSATLVPPSATAQPTELPSATATTIPTLTLTPSIVPTSTATVKPLTVPPTRRPATEIPPTEEPPTEEPPTETPIPPTDTPTETLTPSITPSLTPSLTPTTAPTVLITAPPVTPTLTPTLLPPSLTSSPTTIPTTAAPTNTPEPPTNTPTETLTPTP